MKRILKQLSKESWADNQVFDRQQSGVLDRGQHRLSTKWHKKSKVGRKSILSSLFWVCILLCLSLILFNSSLTLLYSGVNISNLVTHIYFKGHIYRTRYILKDLLIKLDIFQRTNKSNKINLKRHINRKRYISRDILIDQDKHAHKYSTRETTRINQTRLR